MGNIKKSTFPALLKGSLLYDLVKDVEVLPVQHWLAQGLPAPVLVSEQEAAWFPFPSLLKHCSDSPDVLKDTEVRALSGNMMHASCIGACFVFVLAVGDK
eukprot:3311483-Alexandrium_andersonii.AAC.1